MVIIVSFLQVVYPLNNPNTACLTELYVFLTVNLPVTFSQETRLRSSIYIVAQDPNMQDVQSTVATYAHNVIALCYND